MKTTKKTLTSLFVLALTIGLAGCATTNQAVTSHDSNVKTSSVVSSSTKEKTAKQASSQSQASSMSSTTSQSTTATSVNSSSATADNNSSSVANSNVSSDVYNSFVKDSGVSLNQDQSLVAVQNSDGTYQVDVRSTDGDPNIAHLNGTYTYNPSTGSVSENSNQ